MKFLILFGSSVAQRGFCVGLLDEARKAKAPRVTRGLDIDTGRCLHLNHSLADSLVKILH